MSQRHYTHAFTVFTPTYQRAHTLPRVYESLTSQTFTDFEWVIVDDGSTDGTEDVVRNLSSTAPFDVRYFWQENGGQHAAINRGVREARGELFLTMDSDDACLPVALERFKYHWDAIPAGDKGSFSAVTCHYQDPQGELVGTRFPHEPTDSNSLEIRLKHNVQGDKWGFQRTDVLREHPFPEIDGENYLAKSLVWNRIALKYKTRYVNEMLGMWHPSPKSVSTRPVRVTNPIGAHLFYREYVDLDYPMPRMKFIRGYANYVRFSFHAGKGVLDQLKDAPSSRYWLGALPIGLLAYLRDRRMASTS